MWLCDHVLPPSLPVPPAVSISFQPNRTQPLYAGTAVTLVCTVTVNLTLVDTDIMADFNIISNEELLTSSVEQFNASTFQGKAHINLLVPSDNNTLYLCTSTFLPVDITSSVDQFTNPPINYILPVTGEMAMCRILRIIMFPHLRPAPSQHHSDPPNTDHCWGPPHTHLHCYCGGVSGDVPSPAMADC